MNEEFWFYWLGGNVHTASSNAVCSVTMTVTGAKLTQFIPAPPPTQVNQTVDKVRLGRTLFVASSGTKLYKTVHSSFALSTGTFPTSLGNAYANLNSWEGFDMFSSPQGYNVLAYVDVLRNIKLESYSDGTSTWYYGSLPTNIYSDKVSLAPFNWDIVSVKNPNGLTVADKYSYKEFVPTRYERLETPDQYTEVYEESLYFTRQPAQYRHEVYHYTKYNHQTYKPARYQKQVWVPPIYQKQVGTLVPYSETLRLPRAVRTITSSTPPGSFYSVFIAPYITPCQQGSSSQYRRKVYSWNQISGPNYTYKVDYEEWTVVRCPTTTWANVSPPVFLQTDTPPAATNTERWVLYRSGFWEYTTPAEYLDTDTPPAATATEKWVLISAAMWVTIETVELEVKPPDTSTERWVKVTDPYWEALETIFTDTPPASTTLERWVKTANALWRAARVSDDQTWQRYKVTEPRWVKKCTWHSASLPSRTEPPEPFWRLLNTNEYRAESDTTRTVIQGGYEPWVPTSTSDTAPAVTALSTDANDPYAVKFPGTYYYEYREAYYVVDIPAAGVYTIHARGDDVVRVYIDEQLVLEASFSEITNTLRLNKGRYSIRVGLSNLPGPTWMSAWLVSEAGSVVWSTRSAQAAGVISNKGFSLPTYSASVKPSLVVTLDADTYMVSANSGNTTFPLPAGGFAVTSKVNPPLPHFRSSAIEYVGTTSTVQVVSALTHGQVNDAPIYRVQETIPNYLVSERYKTTADNGTYSNPGGTTGLTIDPASATTYLRSPEAYTSWIDSSYASSGRDVSYSAINFTDSQAGGGPPLKGKMFPYLYVISKPVGNLERQALIGEDLTGKPYRQNGTRTNLRKVVDGEDLTGKTLVTVKAGGWRWAYPDETPGRYTTYQNAVSVTATSLDRQPVVAFSGGISTITKNAADFYTADRINTEFDVNLSSIAIAVAGSGNVWVAGSAVDGTIKVGLFHPGSRTWITELQTISAPSGVVLWAALSSTSGTIYLLIDTYQVGGVRQYAVVSVRNGAATAESVRFVEQTAGPADHSDAVAAYYVATGRVINVAFRDRSSKLLRFVRVPVTY